MSDISEKDKKAPFFQNLINECLCQIADQELEIINLKNEVHHLKIESKQYRQMIHSLDGAMKMEFLIQNWNNIKLDHLEGIIR